MSQVDRDTDDLIHAYVRGRLTDAESLAVEESLSADPAQWREFERVFRTHEGLAQLRQRGELTRLIAAPPWYRRAPALAAAAALASVAVGGRWLLESSNSSKEPGLSTSRSGGAAAALLLARTRGNDMPTILKPASGLLDIRVRPEYRSSRFFDLDLTLPAAGNAPPRVLTARGLPLEADGNITVYLSASELPVGEYLVKITPVSGDTSLVSDFEFRIEDSGTTH
jgi:hypothetical protein